MLKESPGRATPLTTPPLMPVLVAWVTIALVLLVAAVFVWGPEFPVARTTGGLIIVLTALLSIVCLMAVSYRGAFAAHQRAEADARRQGELLRAIADGTQDAVFVKDRDGRYLYANRATAEFVGRPVEELIGRDDTELFESASAEMLRRHDHELMAHDRSETSEETATAAGVTRTYLVTKGPMHDEHGAVTGLIGVSCDITSRKRDEQALRDSETRLELALAAARMGVWSIDLTDEPVFWSPEIYEITGHDRAPQGFQGFIDMVLAEDREMVRQAIETAIETRTRYQATFRFRRPDGEIRWLSHNGEGHYDDTGKYTGMRGAVFDITDRMMAEEARHASEERYRHFLDVLPDAVYVVENECVTYCNPAFVSMLGAGRKEDLIGTSSLAMHAPQDHDLVRQCINDTLAGVSVAPVEREIHRVDGRAVPVLVAATQIADIRRRAVLFVLRDLTHQHRVESDLRQAHKMEALGQVAGGVAHDFNNLLTVILGYSDMLQDQFPEGDPRRQFASDIRRASGRAADLTRQLLTFSRRTVVAPKVVDANAVVKDMNRMLRRVLGEDVELAVGLDAKTPKIFIDPGSLEQIVMNLCVNARDAMPNGGTLRITTGHAWRGGSVDVAGNALPAGDYVTVTVADTGDGIPPDVRAHIFEPFFTTKGAGKGTGLGLAVVLGLVEQNGGHILLETMPGHGTSFTVVLPMVDQALTVTREERVRAPRGGGETILVVEDEEPVRRLAVIALASGGYRVLEAADGRAALEVFERHGAHVDLLLTDVVMPHIGGRELSNSLTAKQPSLRVIYTSGYADDAVLRRGIIRAEVPFLAKPYTPSGVLRKVRDVIDQAPTVSPSLRPPA